MSLKLLDNILEENDGNIFWGQFTILPFSDDQNQSVWLSDMAFVKMY